LNLTLEFVIFKFQVFRNDKGITHFRKIFSTRFTKKHYHRNPKAGGRSVSIKIERRVSGVITCSVSLRSATIKPETFEGRKLKIVQVSKQANARIF